MIVATELPLVIFFFVCETVGAAVSRHRHRPSEKERAAISAATLLLQFRVDAFDRASMREDRVDNEADDSGSPSTILVFIFGCTSGRVRDFFR